MWLVFRYKMLLFEIFIAVLLKEPVIKMVNHYTMAGEYRLRLAIK